MHCSADVAPRAELYVPSGHGWHEVADVDEAFSLYMPAEHGRHESRTTLALLP